MQNSKLFFLAFIAVSSAQIVLDNSQSSDSTLLTTSNGQDVVDACIQKILSIPGVSNLFKNDFGFLKRIALVETNFGTQTGSITNGGIWQISPAIIASLNNIPSSLNTLIGILSSSFGSNFVNFNTTDFSIPLHSAIAARIYLEIQFTSQFPGTVADQATWWAANYGSNGSQSQSFVTTVETFENLNSCTVSKLDLWFLIDGSGSVSLANFERCLTFVNQTAASFTITPDRVRTGLMVYTSSTFLRSLFNQHQSNSEFSSLVLSTRYPGGGTSTGAAIRATSEIGFNETNGARPTSEAVPRVLIVLTDGQSGDSVIAPSSEIKQMGVTVFGVGVGSGFVASEINEIASDPDSEYAFEFTQFDALTSVLRERVAEQACTIPAVVPDSTAISLTLTSQSTFYSQVELPSNGSVELSYQVSVTTSIGIVYLSESVPNPNSAFYDATFTVSVGVTTVFYNSIPSSPSTSNRRKRQTDASDLTPKALYVAFVTQGQDPIDAVFTATARNTTVKSGAPTSIPGLFQLSIMSLLTLLLIH